MVHYSVDSEIGFDEDDEHEFKSHRTICADEIPAWAVFEENNKLKRSRQPISKTICAFLNTGKGGICYLGILNDGVVKGIKLTSHQKDHVIVNLHDALKRFTPSVPPNQVKIKFVPVYEEGETDILSENDDVEKIDTDDVERFSKEHVVRTSALCWCDKAAITKYNRGSTPTSYVVEIIVKPWNGECSTKTPLYPVYQNEVGLCFMRRQASNVQVSVQDIFLLTKDQVYNYYMPEIRKLEEKCRRLRLEAEAKMKKT